VVEGRPRCEPSSDPRVQPTGEGDAQRAEGGVPALDQAAFDQFRWRFAWLAFGPAGLLRPLPGAFVLDKVGE
jgi:hypothetical protein